MSREVPQRSTKPEHASMARPAAHAPEAATREVDAATTLDPWVLSWAHDGELSGWQRFAPSQRQQAVLALQRTAGNAATQRLLHDHAGHGTSGTLPGHLLRQPRPRTGPKPQPKPQPRTFQSRLSTLEKRQAAMELDLRWRATFGERLASYRQAILRVSGGLDAASQGFQSAQMAQAQTDQLMTQVVGGAFAVVFALGFEWVVGRALGRLGVSAARAERLIEFFENPANALVSAGVNVAGALEGQESAERGQMPAVGPTGTSSTSAAGGGAAGGAMAFLTGNLEALERHAQGIEQAFAARAQRMQGFTDRQWGQFDPRTQEATYQQLLSELNSSAAGVERMKPAAAVAQVLERHLWALWIRGQRQAELDLRETARESGSPPLALDESRAEPNLQIGADIEVRLNQVGVSGLAGIKLTGHWYSSNSPNTWKSLLLTWASGYAEGVGA